MSEKLSKFQQIVAETANKPVNMSAEDVKKMQEERETQELQKIIESDPRFITLCEADQDPNFNEALVALADFFYNHDPHPSTIIFDVKTPKAEDFKDILSNHRIPTDIAAIDPLLFNRMLDAFFRGGSLNQPEGFTYTISRTGEFSPHLPFAVEIYVYFDKSASIFSFDGHPQAHPDLHNSVRYHVKYNNMPNLMPKPGKIRLRNGKTQTEFLQTIAEIITQTPDPWSTNSLAHEYWQGFCSLNKDAIAFYNQILQTEGEAFPTDHKQVYTSNMRAHYETAIMLINHELDKVKLLRQIAKNTASIDKNASAQQVLLSQIGSNTGQAVTTGKDALKMAGSSDRSLNELRQLVLNLHLETQRLSR